MLLLHGDETAAQSAAFIPYSEVAPVVAALRDDLIPAALRANPAAWPGWVAAHDRAIRQRVARGDEDSVVHLLLFGTSFTAKPRAGNADLAMLAGAPDKAFASLRGRIDDFIAALAVPGDNERLQISRAVITRAGVDAGDAAAVRRFLEQRMAAVGQAGAAQLASMVTEPADTGTIFRERGLSSDTTVSVNLGIERTLQALADARLVRPASVRRVAVVGPGLDFIDKQQGYDFYPLQTIQPFAVLDSLQRVGLAASGSLRLDALDLSPRVLGHLEAARARARAGQPYRIVLTRDSGPQWEDALVEYWQRAGNFVAVEEAAGRTQAPAAPPGVGRVELRAVAIRPETVLSVTPRDLNIVTERLELPDEERYDLVIATNILLYYDVFEQSLAMANVARMLRSGGLLLSNSRLVELPRSPLSAVGFTDSTYMTMPGIGATGDRVMWYQRP